ncbi:TPA: KxYKxGKxW signal peptide domain-containing protein, partial [Streptococcus suis]
MRRFKRKTNIVEISRKTRVRMHKSGKNWVRTIFSSIQTKKLNIRYKKIVPKQQSEWSRSGAYIKKAALLGAIIGGYPEAGMALAEEIVVSETSKNILATADIVGMSTHSSTPSSHSVEESSTSLVHSLSASQSISEIVSSSDLVSESDSESTSESISTFISHSESASLSMSESDSVSAARTFQSEDAVSDINSVVESHSEDEGISSESILVTISESPESESIADRLKSLDTSRFDLAVSALQMAMEHHLPETIDTTSSPYQRYIVAKQGAEEAFILVNNVLNGSVADQKELDSISIRIAQAANNVTGRLNQLTSRLASVGTSLRSTSSSILVFSESDNSAKYRDRQISLVEGRLDTTTNLIEWTVTYQPVQSLTEAYAGFYIAAVTEMGPPQNLKVNGIPLLLDTSIRNRETLGTNLSTTDYTGRFYGNNYSLGAEKVSLSGPITYTFSTRVGSSLANIALYVQAALHPTDSIVHATYNEANGRTNLSGMLIGYRASFVADSMNSFLQSTSESIQNSLSIRQSISQSQSLSVSESRSVSLSQSQSLSLSTSQSASLSVSELISESVSISESSSHSESLVTSVSDSVSESVSGSISESVSVSLSASISESVLES